MFPYDVFSQWNLQFEGTGEITREYIAIGKATKKENIRIVEFCSTYASEADVVYKNVEPTGITKKLGKYPYSEVRAQVIKHISLWDGVSSESYPGGGRSGVKTFLEVKGSKDKPLRLSENLEVWQVVVFKDSSERFTISAGTWYRLNCTEERAVLRPK
jgi:hypothetical protein